MTNAIFREWLIKIDKQFKSENRKVILFLDNFSGHCDTPKSKKAPIQLTNIKVVFLIIQLEIEMHWEHIQALRLYLTQQQSDTSAVMRKLNDISDFVDERESQTAKQTSISCFFSKKCSFNPILLFFINNLEFFFVTL
jgi:hypothetical protein